MAGCTPVRYVNVQKRHNYYQNHRYNTYTVPTWVPGFGILLETRIYHNNRVFQRHPLRGRR